MTPGLTNTYRVDKTYKDGGFELHWREGPLHRFHGVTWDATFSGHQNDSAHYDDGWGSWPFPKASEDLPLPLESDIERFGLLNAWLLAWWPWLAVQRGLPREGSFKDLPALNAPRTGLLPGPQGDLEPGRLTIHRDASRLTLTLETPGATRTLPAHLVTWFPELGYLELRVELEGGHTAFWMLDLRADDGPLFTERPDLVRGAS